MFKLLKLSTITAATTVGTVAATIYGYKKLTKFETNITVSDIHTKQCITEGINRHIVETDKGNFVLQNKLKILHVDIGPMLIVNEFSYQYKPMFELEKGYTFHVTGYGLDYPKLHLYKTIISNNGTPCTSNEHCGEKPSMLSFISNKF